jgi:hypothetical protein
MPHRFRAHAWLVLAMLVSLVPFVQGLSATRIFYIRDLALYFWPRHLSLLDAWARGIPRAQASSRICTGQPIRWRCWIS